jgi:hypothetical protein
MQRSFAVAAVALFASTAPAVAQAQCNLKPGQAAEIVGDVDEAWVNRAGTALYKVETDELTCDAEVAYLFDPRGILLCRVGQHMKANGTYQPVTFDFTGSGYWVRVESVECR